MPPHLVKEDQLHDRFACAKDGISELMHRAIAEIVVTLSKPLIRVNDEGRILACHAENGAVIVPVYNPSDKNLLTAIVEIDESLCSGKTVTCDVPVTCLSEGKYRIRLEPDESAYLVIS